MAREGNIGGGGGVAIVCRGFFFWFSERMAQGKKLLVSLAVRAFIDLKCLPEGSRLNRWWAGWAESLKIDLVLLRQQESASSSREGSL